MSPAPAGGVPHPEVRAVELVRASLPLRAPFRTAWGELADRDVVLVRVVTAGDVEGWGECAALPVAGYAAETTATAWADLRDRLVPALLDPRSGPAPAGPMAAAALDTALLDAACRSWGVPLAARLGGCRDRVASGAVIGVTGDVAAVVAAAKSAVTAGQHRVKLKVAPGWDVEPLTAVRRALGEHVVLGADANGSYEPSDAAVRLGALDGLGLAMVEQPLAPAAGLGALAELAAAIGTPVCLDESITGEVEVAEAGRLGACRVVNVKPGRVGGLVAARGVAGAAARAGMAVFVGGMLETGIGRAAALALATVPECNLPADLGPSSRYFAEDLTEPFELGGDGCLAVPAGPGLGVTPRPDVLRRAVRERVLLRR